MQNNSEEFKKMLFKTLNRVKVLNDWKSVFDIELIEFYCEYIKNMNKEDKDDFEQHEHFMKIFKINYHETNGFSDSLRKFNNA